MTRQNRQGMLFLLFLLTCLLRGMTGLKGLYHISTTFLLTCLLRGMTGNLAGALTQFAISTHMPLARHDSFWMWSRRYRGNFYSHASCEAWRRSSSVSRHICHFYSHASCEAWQHRQAGTTEQRRFLLTCLLRGMTLMSKDKDPESRISTHMPLARHDKTYADTCPHKEYFYSHASCEAWLMNGETLLTELTFLLTCLLRGMTFFVANSRLLPLISTHMPLARHDVPANL